MARNDAEMECRSLFPCDSTIATPVFRNELSMARTRIESA